MSRGRWAGIVAALAIAAVAAVTAGCGGGGSALALDPVAAAATKTQQAGAARVRFVVDFGGPRIHGHNVKVSGFGAVDGTSSRLTIDLGALAQQSLIPAGAKSLREVSLEQNGDYVVYLQSDLLAQRLPGGQHWIELDLSKLAQAKGFDLGTLLSGSQIQPGDVLSMLEAEGAKVQKLGSATIDGAPVTHYRVMLDVAKALQASGLKNPQLAHLAAKTRNVPTDVWIGKDGLVRRVHVTFEQTKNGAPVHAGLTVDVFDYGAPVTIAAPPSNDVFDATQLAQSFRGYSR